MLALMTKTELTDDQWRHVHPLLPPPRKGRVRPRADDRMSLTPLAGSENVLCRKPGFRKLMLSAAR